MDSNGGTYAQNPFVLDKMYKDKMYFTSTDNDPPEIVIEARTSFTEVDQFLLGLTSQNLSYSYANFSAPSTYAKDVYAAKLRGNDPSNWAESVVDALTGTSSDTYGTAYLTITKGSAARGITSDIGTIASDTTTNSEKIMAGLNTLIKAKMPDYQVQIPERSRAIFSVQVFDNIPEGAAHQMPIDPAASGHIYLQTPNITHANGGDESDLEKFKVEILANHGRDPKREETWNYYGTFHTPMKDNVNDAVVVFSAKDKAGNETMVQVPVKVIDTYVKKDRLDLERQRTN
jgi:hypothetical protein